MGSSPLSIPTLQRQTFSTLKFQEAAQRSTGSRIGLSGIQHCSPTYSWVISQVNYIFYLGFLIWKMGMRIVPFS